MQTTRRKILAAAAGLAPAPAKAKLCAKCAAISSATANPGSKHKLSEVKLHPITPQSHIGAYEGELVLVN